jgi:opacity protein-like surface antigen
MARFTIGVGIAAVGLACLTAPAAAQDRMPQDLKAVWNTLTPAEQAAYEAMGRRSAGSSSRGLSRAPGDTCAAATLEVSALPFVNNNTTVGLADDMVFGAACNGFNESSGVGPDIAYLVRTDVDCDVEVDMDPVANDLALWVVTDCADPVGGCVGGDDSNGSGVAEQVAFSAAAGVDHFIVVDGFAGASDAFALTVTETSQTGCALVPVQLQGFAIE